MVARMMAVPASVVKSLSSEMVAPVAPGSTTLHSMVLNEAYMGETVPERDSGTPAIAEESTLLISFTGRKGDEEKTAPLV